MGLWAVGLPEGGGGWVQQGGGSAVRFVRADGPCGEGGDLAEAET